MTVRVPEPGLPLGQAFFVRPVTEVARDLVGRQLVVRHPGGERRVRIVETEAYGGTDDPASHAGRGPTPRSAIMFGPAGFAYVYLIYGMHHCLNLVTGPAGEAGAVLLRAGEPLAGIPARPGTPAGRLGAGPGRLCCTLGLDLAWNGVPVAADLPGAGSLEITAGEPAVEVLSTPRIGIRRARTRPWRFVAAGSLSLSRPPAAAETGRVDKRASRG